MRRIVLAHATLAALALASCGDSPPPGCSGHVELCDRRYDEVAFAATHNAMANTDEDRIFANQTHPVPRQLDDGIRGLMLDAHYDSSDPPVPRLCHAGCVGTEQTLTEGLADIRRFLDRHPKEVVTIIFESYVSKGDVVAAFEASGAIRYVHTQAVGSPWPTLREMIDAGHRLVVFTDHEPSDGSDGAAWYMDQWAHAFQNPYAAATKDDFSCDVDRGSGTNAVFILNHFLTNGVGMLSYAEEVNAYAVLEPHVSRCESERGRIPNFVTVDFYEVGDLFAMVDALNGLGVSP